MNAVEIEEAISDLAIQQFNAAEFPYEFLKAFDVKDTTLKNLRRGSTNASDVAGGVLLRNNIHMATCGEGKVGVTLKSLRDSPRTRTVKAKFILATDGVDFEAEELGSGEVVACAYRDFPEHFGFFLPLAGISTVREITNNPIDIKATGRLNKLYLELLKTNQDWATAERRNDLNHFLARLIFCFFAEDTGIFTSDLFTSTIEQMTDPQSSNTHEVILELFKAMDTKREERADKRFRPWADKFPYVNGGLFAGAIECPKFSRIARSYLLRAGELDWKTINPDIFGSMIQAVAEDDERGSLGMHYTSVPNILKVLNPLFLDELREQLDAAGDNSRKLKNLQKRISSIRVFDPACGSGNFLVIAYIQMREIENEIIKRLADGSRTVIKLENFFGIEIKSFPVEIAKLSLLIAEFQCDVRFYGESVAWLNVLPLHRTGQIHVANALRKSWIEVCPAITDLTEVEWDLAGPTGRLALDQDFHSHGRHGETYVCGNPPFAGQIKKTAQQREDMDFCLADQVASYKNLDFVCCWYFLASAYQNQTGAKFAFVSTNSICQGRQVELLWGYLFSKHKEINFARRPFKWTNNARSNAGVTCIIVGVDRELKSKKRLYVDNECYLVDKISGYLTHHYVDPISPARVPISELPQMSFGSMPNDGGYLLLSSEERRSLINRNKDLARFIRPYLGADELVTGTSRFCFWLEGDKLIDYQNYEEINTRVELVRQTRNSSKRGSTKALASSPHLFGEIRHREGELQIVIPAVTSEERPYLPVFYLNGNPIISNRCFVIYGADLYSLSVIASSCHRVWIDAVCGKLESRYNYSNTLGWNTFPLPKLTENNKRDLKACADNILLARERHYPLSLAELYDPSNIPDDLRRAHEENDEVLERIYIGRRFKNDTERLERLFQLYSEMNEGSTRTQNKK